MTIRRWVACKSKDHTYRDCNEKWRRNTYINPDILSTIIDMITTTGDYGVPTLCQVRLCNKLFKSIADNSISHFITNDKGPIALIWLKYYSRLLVIAQFYRTPLSLDSAACRHQSLVVAI